MLVLREQAVCLPILSSGKFSALDTNHPFQNGNQRDGRERTKADNKDVGGDLVLSEFPA